ncbi:hypothetical protein EHS39_17695 [Ensifer sp. MPMI2T]|nr:hypothetical protein EHS39_17695 [Ensifer sp. MPMI2T]
MAYLTEMGIDPQLLQLSLSISSSDIRYLTAAEMAQFRVTTSGSRANRQAVPTVEAQTPGTPPPSAALSMEAKALVFVAQYHEAWSRVNSQAMAFMRIAYADSVNFYGKEVSREDVLKEKAIFAERWPRRAYSVRHGSERVACGSICTISGVVEWYAHSPQRTRSSSGAADFSLIWNPATNQILAETGRVISADKKAKDPSRIIAQWQDQNGECRGGAGNSDETLRACDRREAIGAKLEAVGWCYGREGEYGYQMAWHVCGR